MRMQTAGAIGVLLAGCAQLRPVERTATPVAGGDCGAVATLPEALAAPGSVVLFGELHGTRELPAFFAEAVCHASSREEVVVGLEIPGSEQGRIDRFLASAGSGADRAALLAGPFWTDPDQDGRRSEAVLALLERIRGLRATGGRIDVLAYDVEPAEYGPDRDARMARTIAAHAGAHPRAVTLVFSGNVHARTTVGVPWDPALEPTGWHLRQAGVSVRSLDAAWPAGTAWLCWREHGDRPDEKPVCGPRPLGASKDLPARPGIALHPRRSAEGFDGVYAVTSLSASPPAARPPGG